MQHEHSKACQQTLDSATNDQRMKVSKRTSQDSTVKPVGFWALIISVKCQVVMHPLQKQHRHNGSQGSWKRTRQNVKEMCHCQNVKKMCHD